MRNKKQVASGRSILGFAPHLGEAPAVANWLRFFINAHPEHLRLYEGNISADIYYYPAYYEKEKKNAEKKTPKTPPPPAPWPVVKVSDIGTRTLPLAENEEAEEEEEEEEKKEEEEEWIPPRLRFSPTLEPKGDIFYDTLGAVKNEYKNTSHVKATVRFTSSVDQELHIESVKEYAVTGAIVLCQLMFEKMNVKTALSN